jgi:tRNA threonylcarbamoyladenosine dehydratase
VKAVATKEAPDDQRRFGGLARLYGAVGASQIVSAHVVVVGVGGVGSWSAEALARSGVGRISLIDMDHVSESNINRQIHATTQTLGQSKIEAMRERMASINPNGIVHLIDDFVTPQNWSELAQRLAAYAPITALIDACDQVAAKTTMAAWILNSPSKAKPEFVTVGAAGGKQRAQLVDIDDLFNTTHDPLLAKMRYNLRRQHGAAREGRLGVTCVYSRESVQAPQSQSAFRAGTTIDAAVGKLAPSDTAPNTDGSLNCHGFGSSVGVTATFGMCAASYVLEKLAKLA